MSKTPVEFGALPFPEGGLDAFISRPCEETLAVLERYPGDILVLGAAGKMGLHLCMMLQEGLEKLGRKNVVHAASRFQSVSGWESFEALGIKTWVGDFRNKEYLDTLPDCPSVFYLVGAKFGTSGNPEILEEINVRLAKSLGERFSSSRIVALSTGCVYPYVSPETGGCVEDAARDPVGEYALSCVGREKSFEEVSSRHGTLVALVRLNYAVELRYGVLVDIATCAWKGEPVSLAMAWVNVIWQGDALNQIIQCLDYVGTPPRAVNVTGRDILSVRDLALGFGRRFGKEVRFEGSEQSETWLSNCSWATKHLSAPRVGLEELMNWIALWVREGKPSHGKPTGFERRDGKF